MCSSPEVFFAPRRGWPNQSSRSQTRIVTYFFERQGMIKEAIHCYVTAVRLMPKFAAVHSNLGSVLKEQGKLVRNRKRKSSGRGIVSRGGAGTNCGN